METLLNLKKIQNNGAKAKAGKVMRVFFNQHCCCGTVPGVGTYGADSCSEDCSLVERCFASLLWHLQVFPHREFPLLEVTFQLEEVSIPTMAMGSRA